MLKFQNRKLIFLENPTVTWPHFFLILLIFHEESAGIIEILKFKLFRICRNKVWNQPISKWLQGRLFSLLRQRELQSYKLNWRDAPVLRIPSHLPVEKQMNHQWILETFVQGLPMNRLAYYNLWNNLWGFSNYYVRDFQLWWDTQPRIIKSFASCLFKWIVFGIFFFFQYFLWTLQS